MQICYDVQNKQLIMKKVTFPGPNQQNSLQKMQDSTSTIIRQQDKAIQKKQSEILRLLRLLNQSQQQNQNLLSQKVQIQNISNRFNHQLEQMRKRAQTVTVQAHKTIEQLILQLQNTKRQLFILKSKYEELEKERDILKEGNTSIISDFIFNKNKQGDTRSSLLLKHRESQIVQLKRQVFELKARITKMEAHQNQEHQNSSVSSIITVPLTKNKDKSQNQQKNDLTKKLFQLQKLYKDEKIKNSQLQQQNFNLGKEIQILNKGIQQINIQIRNPKGQIVKLNEEIKRNKNQILSRSQQMTLAQRTLDEYKHKCQQFEGQIQKLTNNINSNVETFKAKQHQLLNQNQSLMEKYALLQKENSFLKQSNQNHLCKEKQNQALQTNKVNFFTDKSFKITSSIYHTETPNENLKDSLMYASFCDSQRPDSLAAQTQKIEKKITKLQKVNTSLEKDYKQSQQKIKTLNRQYSKLKLDHLKSADQMKQKDSQFQRKAQTLTNRLQSLTKKNKQQENLISSLRNQRESEKSVFKQIILELQSLKDQKQKQYQQLRIQNIHLKEQVGQIRSLSQKTNSFSAQLQHQKVKYKNLQKQTDFKTKQFKKCLAQYEQMLADFRKINSNSLNSLNDKQKKSIASLNNSQHSQSSGKSRLQGSRSKNKSEISLSFQNQTLFRAFKEQIQQLQANLKLQNQRYNILQNSNRQLRKQLLKMIEQQEKLRKDLINQKIKSRTNSISSKNSRTFSSKRLREQFSSIDKGEQRNLNVSTSRDMLTNRLNYANGSSSNLNTQRRTSSIQKPTYMPLNLPLNNAQAKLTQQKTIQNKYLDASKNKNSYLKTLRQKRFNTTQNHQTTHKINNHPNMHVNSNIYANQSIYWNQSIHGNQDLHGNQSINQNHKINGNQNDPKYKNSEANKYQTKYFSNMLKADCLNSESKEESDSMVQNDSYQITLQISSSKSNFSKRQNLQMQNFRIDVQKTQKQQDQPKSASRTYSKYDEVLEGPQKRPNILLMGKNPASKSTSEVRFARKTKNQGSLEKNG